MPITLAKLKRLNKGEYVIVGKRFRRVGELERRRQGIGITLQPTPAICKPLPNEPMWVLPDDVHIPGTPLRGDSDIDSTEAGS
jgi:hypothetical protein